MTTNLANAAVLIPPTDALNGTVLTVESGHGAWFTSGKAYLRPAIGWAQLNNSEVVNITSVVGDVITFIRVAEGTYGRAIQAGDRLIQTVTAAMWDALPSTFAPATRVTQAQQFRTLLDGSQQLTNVQPPPFAAVSVLGASPVIVQPDERYQEILGFGAALTESAAWLLMTKMTQAQRTALLTELYSPTRRNWSTVRISLGSSDFNLGSLYTYDDMPAGGTDVPLTNFSTVRDGAYVIPVLREILAINPQVRVLAMPWTVPAWMKATNPSFLNGTFNATYYTQFASYLVKAIQAYQGYGIPIWAIAPMNEPIGAAFSLSMAGQLNTFVGTYLGPAIGTAGLDVKILALDDSWSVSSTASSLLADATAGPYWDAVGWHAYVGTPSAQDTIHRAFPTKGHHLTEMRNLLSETAAQATAIMAGDLVVGSLRYWSQSITLWNMALDETGAPNGGSTGRQGVVTIPSSGSGIVVRNTGYWALCHVSQFLQPGARRCHSTTYAIGKAGTAVETVSFVNPDNSVVLFMYNPGSATTFQVADGRSGMAFPVSMATGEMSTFAWGTTAVTGPAGSPASLTTPAAATLVPTGGPARVALSWAAPSAGSAPITVYALYRGTVSGSLTQLIVLPGSATSYTDSGVAAGTYYYRLVASSAAGVGASSAEVSATATAATAPGAPVLGGAAGDSTVALTWTSPSTNGSALTSFTVRRGTSPGGETDLATGIQPGILTYADNTAVNGTTYYYTVVAINGVGSTTSNEVSAAPAAVVRATFDALATVGNNGVSSLTQTVSHTVGAGSHRLLLVAVQNAATGTGMPSISAVTYGGTGLTHVGSSLVNSGTGTIDRQVDLWSMVNPPSGAATVSVTVSIAANFEFTAISFANVNQATPLGTPVPASTTAGTALSMDTAVTPADVVLSIASVRSSGVVSPGGSQTSRWGSLQGANLYVTGSTQDATVTGTITSTWTWTTSDRAAALALTVHGG